MGNIDYGKILKRSWFLTWKNKWLWVMGLVLALFGSGSGGGGGGGSSTGGKSLTPESSPAPSFDEGGEVYKVLGDATNIVKDWFTAIPVTTWILVGAIVLLFVIFTMLISWILTSWAEGALIAGLNEADKDTATDLKNVSPMGTRKIKDLIIFKLIYMGIFLAVLAIIATLIGLGFVVKLFVPILGIIWIILFGTVGIVSFLIAVVLLIMVNIYAKRLIVLENYSAWAAWKKGLTLGKGNFIPTIVMGIINSMIGCTTGCAGFVVLLLIFAVPGWLLISPIFRDGEFHLPPTPNIVGITVLIVLFFSLSILIRAVFVVFNYGNWNLLFKEIYAKKHE